MIAELLDTSYWNHEQWLAAVILVFVLVTIGLVLYRINKLFGLSRKSTYSPNLRPLRRGRVVRERVVRDGQAQFVNDEDSDNRVDEENELD